MENCYRVLVANYPQHAEYIMNDMWNQGYKVIEVSYWRDAGSDKIIITFQRNTAV